MKVFCDVDHMTQQQVKERLCNHGYCTPKAQEKVWYQWVCTNNPVCADGQEQIAGTD
jgi:hypothetical protein